MLVPQDRPLAEWIALELPLPRLPELCGGAVQVGFRIWIQTPPELPAAVPCERDRGVAVLLQSTHLEGFVTHEHEQRKRVPIP